jgi:DNA-binding NarL/FixJ family response regulator
MATEAQVHVHLTRRELEILALMAEGFGSKAIGWKLNISHRTIEIYRGRIKGKLGARCGMHAVAIAISKGIIPILA